MTSARIVRGFLACSLGILIPLSAFADVRADMGAAVTVQPTTRLPPGSTASVTVTVMNYGPDDATYVAAGSSRFLDGPGEQIWFYPTAESTCDFYYSSVDPGNPGQAVPYGALLIFTGQVLKPGESISCTIGLYVFLDAKGQYPLHFYGSNDVVGSVDPNPANDQSRDIILNLAPITVPTLGTLGCVLLVLIIVFLGLKNLKMGESYARGFSFRNRGPASHL